MGFFNMVKQLFSKKPPQIQGSQLVTLGINGGTFQEYRKEFNATYCNCAQALARHVSKLDIQVTNENGHESGARYLNRILKYQPNILQTAANFWESVAYDYYFTGASFIYIERDYFSDVKKTKVKALWPIPSNDIVQMKASNNTIYIQFRLNTEMRYASLADFVVLVRSPRTYDPLNITDPFLTEIFQILATNNQGLIKAVENSQAVRFVVTSSGMMDEKMLRDNQATLDERINRSKSILYMSQAENLQQLTTTSKWAPPDDVKEVKKEIYYFFGCSEKFLAGEYDENIWQSTYESAIEPFIVTLSQELSVKIFSEREFEFGNRIAVITNRLQTASYPTKISVATAYMKLPTICPNVVCDILDLPHLENGDREVQSLNFVDATKVNNYQGVGNSNPTKEEPSKEDPEDGSTEEDKTGT